MAMRWVLAGLVALGGCALQEGPRQRVATLEEARAQVERRLPARLSDRQGWAADIHAAMQALKVEPSAQNVCAVVAVTEQESGFQVDPAVPNLPAIAAGEIERLRARAGIPKLVLQGALAVPSSNGTSYGDRIAAARTELELSEIYEDMIGRVPLARRFLDERNPVRTGGPMQVSIAFARAHVEEHRYPYPIEGSVRREVFTRRGGMYFGIAHLLGYPAPYDAMIHRFADFNAGHYASRNAAFQNALARASDIPLTLDGDLVRFEQGAAAKEPGQTETAARTIASRLDMTPAEIRRDLEQGGRAEFGKTRLNARVFALADKASGKPLPRAMVPRIALQSSKISRPLTTDWFARRVESRYRACLAR